MPPATQLQHFCNDLDALIDRYASEYDLSYASMIGALEMKSHLLCQEALDNHNDDREDLN